MTPLSWQQNCNSVLWPLQSKPTVITLSLKSQLTVDVFLDGDVVHGHVVRNGRRVFKDGGVDVFDERRRRLVINHDRHPDLFRHEDEILDTSTHTSRPFRHGQIRKKGKEAYLYSAFYILCISQSAQAWITACLSFVCVHQMAPPLTEVRDI